jgi:hypothetical protein
MDGLECSLRGYWCLQANKPWKHYIIVKSRYPNWISRLTLCLKLVSFEMTYIIFECYIALLSEDPMCSKYNLRQQATSELQILALAKIKHSLAFNAQSHLSPMYINMPNKYQMCLDILMSMYSVLCQWQVIVCWQNIECSSLYALFLAGFVHCRCNTCITPALSQLYEWCIGEHGRLLR